MSGYISGGLLLYLFHGHLKHMAKGHPPIRRPRRRAPAAEIQEPIGHRGHLLPEAGGLRCLFGQGSAVYLHQIRILPGAVALKTHTLLDPGLETLQLQSPLDLSGLPFPTPSEAPAPAVGKEWTGTETPKQPWHLRSR